MFSIRVQASPLPWALPRIDEELTNALIIQIISSHPLCASAIHCDLIVLCELRLTVRLIGLEPASLAHPLIRFLSLSLSKHEHPMLPANWMPSSANKDATKLCWVFQSLSVWWLFSINSEIAVITTGKRTWETERLRLVLLRSPTCHNNLSSVTRGDRNSQISLLIVLCNCYRTSIMHSTWYAGINF